ncbi:hypothetical protein [Zooshikella sp. RANM57]|uniref:hypothetical protein n=1 Tax=Zooshikella sp. RANM57 TaxID=3425863 RepID=UPI003D6FA262
MISHRAEITIFPPENGGRASMPVSSGYSPYACSPTGQEYLPIIFHDVPPSAAFDIKFEAIIELRYPNNLDYKFLTSGEGFDLVEGMNKIGYAKLIV